MFEIPTKHFAFLLVYKCVIVAIMCLKMLLCRTFNDRLGPPPCDDDEASNVLDLSRISSAARLPVRATKLVVVCILKFSHVYDFFHSCILFKYCLALFDVI